MENFLDISVQKYFKKIQFTHLLIFLLLIIAIVTRLHHLGVRVMSHDEVNHVVPAFDLFSGRGYRHDPITHGPFQFPLMALSYFLFGDNDFSSRLPHALFSIATIAFVLIFYRRYLGKYGSLAAGIFFIISPFMMFYGRYARNEAICAFWAVVSLYVILRYFEDGRPSRYFVLASIFALNFTTKETAYIFTAGILVFLFILFIYQFFSINFSRQTTRKEILIINLVAVIVIALAITLSIILANRTYLRIQTNVIDPTQSLPDIFNISGLFSTSDLQNFILALPMMVPLASSLIILGLLKKSIDWYQLRQLKAFNLLILIGTLVLPLLAPFLVRFAGMDPTAYGEAFINMANIIYIGYLFILAVLIGTFWEYQNWWKCSLAFFSIYIVLFTTFFTNPIGLITGLVGSLGHWLPQHAIQRGGQPQYYFAFILIPIYEFLGAFGSLLALYFGIKHRSFWMTLKQERSSELKDEVSQEKYIPSPAIFLFSTIANLIAYSIAGERMPWLTVHIAVSMLLTAGWSFERLIQSYISSSGDEKNRLVRNVLISIFFLLIVLFIVQLWGNKAPFQGKTQEQLQNTNHFLFLIFAIGSLGYYLFRQGLFGTRQQVFNKLGIFLFFFLSLLTARTAYQASFINYDYPYEFLVYAHAADGPKMVLDQIEEISRRSTGGLDIKVAYDNHALYPYWWYLRNYPNKIVYLENPTRALEEAPLIIAGSDKYSKIDAIVRDNYYSNEYMRLWWPMQDYWNLNWERVSDALTNPDMRQALLNIWLNRDYRLYAQITNNQFLTLENWLPSEKMRFYVRKDIASEMWKYHTEASLETIVQTDPYKELIQSRQADYFISRGGSLEGELDSPRGIDVAPDGTIYVADSRNHRIQQFSPNGNLIRQWGRFANVLEGSAPGGTFNEPWDVAVGADGSIYVADTFNHRIQKFSAQGQFIKMWGVFAQGDAPDTLWGPRGITISADGNIFITDTGNKRVVIFDQDLNYVSQFGGAGFEIGQFDEPVGIAVSNSGLVAVADTWNRRVQVFQSETKNSTYYPLNTFEVEAWFGQSMNNKPYLTFTSQETIIISDPEADRILEFTIEGEFIRGWQDLSPSPDDISSPYGLDFDENSNLWVSDGAMNMILRFSYE